MSEGFGFETPPAFNPQFWQHPRWLEGTPMLETAHALARAGLGEVIDDGEGLAGWRPCPKGSVIVILSDRFNTALDRLEQLFLTAEGITRRSTICEVGDWVRFQIIPDAHRWQSADRVRGLNVAAYWDWCVTRLPDPELLHVLRYRSVWQTPHRKPSSSAIAPTLPDEACDRQTQFGGAVEDDGPSDHWLDALCLASEVAARPASTYYTVFPPVRAGDWLHAHFADSRTFLPAPPPLELSKGEPEA